MVKAPLHRFLVEPVRMIQANCGQNLKKSGFMTAFLLVLAMHVSGSEITYHFEKDMSLLYTLDLVTELHSDPNNQNLFVPFHSRYDIHLYVLNTKPNGEACLALTSQLNSARVGEGLHNLKGRDDKEIDSYRKWTAGFKKTDSAAVILDRYGNIVRGRMVWPESTCYNLPKILEGISLGRKRADPPLGGRFRIDNRIAETETHEGKSYTILRTQNRLLDLALLFDNKMRLPLSLEAKYGYKTFGSVFVEHLKLRLADVLHNQKRDSFLDDASMMSAILQAAWLARSYDLEPAFVQKALLSRNTGLRRMAASYCSVTGVLDGFGPVKGEKDEIVKLNLAKAALRWGKDSDPLIDLSHRGGQDIKSRAQQVLSYMQSGFVKATSPTLESFPDLLPELSEKEAYRMARDLLSPGGREISHLGPRSFGLSSGVNGNRIFHYSVYVPGDYDPLERYPCLIELSGGNGFAESVFLRTMNIVPDNYILVSPDADYGMWWAEDQIRMFNDLLGRILRGYAVDPDRIYLHGFSNGGMAAYLYGFLHPDRFAAVATLEGCARPTDGGRGVETEMSLNMINTPLLIMHGDRDSVVSIEPDRQLAEFLNRNSIPYRFVELPGVGHTVTFGTYHEKIMGFFRKHRRNSVIKKLHLVVDDMKYNRNFWIRVDAKADPEQRARVKAEVKKGQFILKTKNIKKISLLLNDSQYDLNTIYEIKVNKKVVFRGSLKLDPALLMESLRSEDDVARLYGVCLSFDID